MDLEDRYTGSLLGLACGDALGTTLEFSSPGNLQTILEIEGGGPFQLPPGYWTDDTSMAMCLSESLLACGGFSAQDQMDRYVRWWRQGHWSSTGQCFDIGTATQQALERYVATGEAYSGSTDPLAAGNGSLMRLAPVVLYYRADAGQAIRMAGESSRTTHSSPACVDACRYLAALILGALAGESKETLCGPAYAPVAALWQKAPLEDQVAEVAGGSFKRSEPPVIQGSGFVVRSLEAALWAFYRGRSFEEGALLAVNLGEDADTTGAIYGQLAGAYYGETAIPERWRAILHRGGEIREIARRLYRVSVKGPDGSVE